MLDQQAFAEERRRRVTRREKKVSSRRGERQSAPALSLRINKRRFLAGRKRKGLLEINLFSAISEGISTTPKTSFFLKRREEKI